jgi:hypothetical protein
MVITLLEVDEAVAAAGCCVSPSQPSALRTLYIGFKKAMLRKAKENMGLCGSKDQDFKSYADTVFRFYTGTRKEVRE